MGISCVNGSKGWCRTCRGILQQPFLLSYRDSYKLLFCYERGEFSLGVNEMVEKEKYFRKKETGFFSLPLLCLLCLCKGMVERSYI